MVMVVTERERVSTAATV